MNEGIYEIILKAQNSFFGFYESTSLYLEVTNFRMDTLNLTNSTAINQNSTSKLP
jgi:hypothetical protein